MANITITKIGDVVEVDFGNYAVSNSLDGKKAAYKVDDISIVWLEKDDSAVYVRMKDFITNNNWKLSYTAIQDGFVVDTVDGIAPTSNEDLMDKINALR